MKLRTSYTPDIAKHRLNTSAMERVRPSVVKPLMIDGIYRKKLNPPRINKIAQRANHPLVFQFPLIPRAGRESHHRRPPMPIHHHAQINSQPRRIPAVILTLHESPLCPTIYDEASRIMPATRNRSNETGRGDS